MATWTTTPAATSGGVFVREAGALPDGRVVHEYTLARDGLIVRGLTWGATITALLVPDAAGRVANVVRGFDRLDDYVGPHPYLGCIVGRYANRIAGGRFDIDGRTYQVPCNDGAHALHGGPLGFGRRLWTLSAPATNEPPAIGLHLDSEDGEDGFPGRMAVHVTFALKAGRRWQVDVEARTDRPTLFNPSRHEYFNLAGSGTILDHVLHVPASRYHPVDAGLIPTGLDEVAGTPFDLRAPRVLGDCIGQAHPQLAVALGGYDHHWWLDAPADGDERLAATLWHPASGRRLVIRTTAPGIQVYSGNQLDGRLAGHAGEPLKRHGAVCLEPQLSPDTPHHPEWPSAVLRPGVVGRWRSVYAFDTTSSEGLPDAQAGGS